MALFAGCIGLRPIGDNSFFTHLQTGRLILESGLFRQDPYSFTAAGEPWVIQSWLASVLYAAADRIGGGLGLRVLTAVLIAVLVALVWRLTRRAPSLVVRVLLTGLFILVGATFWAPRPLLFGLVLFAGLLVLFEDRRDPRWAIPLMWVWVNCHGSFPLGLVALGSLALGIWLDHRDPKRALRFLLWATLGTLLGAVGPIGPAILVFPVHLLGRMDILHRVIEWQSPDFSMLYARLFLVQVVLAVIALVRRPRYRAAVPMVVFVAAALLGLRNVPMASIVLMPGLAAGFASVRGLAGLTGRERGPGVLMAGAFVVVAALVVASSLAAQPSYDLASYPTDALAWMRQHGLTDARTRIATQDTTGNAIELLLGPETPVFLDDRFDMYPMPVLQDYLLLHAGAPEWEQVLDRYAIDCILWSKAEPLPQLVTGSQRWAVQYQDSTWLVACRPGVVPT